jgi:hypothetical protein
MMTQRIKLIAKIANLLVAGPGNTEVKITYSHLQGMFVLDISGLPSAPLVDMDDALDVYITALKASLNKKLEESGDKFQKLKQEADEILNPKVVVS